VPKEPYPQRKRTRLDSEAYADVNAICSVTVCTLAHVPAFRDSVLAAACVDMLVAHAKKADVRLHAFCLMPDHLHLLISPSEQMSIIDFVRDIKNLSTRISWQHGFSGKIWQHGFYDHFLRRDEHVELAAQYILGNPVKAGIVREWMEYPFCRSLAYDT
jgi:putative transposase